MTTVQHIKKTGITHSAYSLSSVMQSTFSDQLLVDMGKPAVMNFCPNIYCFVDKSASQVQHNNKFTNLNDKGLSYYSGNSYTVMIISTTQPFSGLNHHCTCIQECIVGQVGWDELVIPTNYPTIQYRHRTPCSMNKTASKLLIGSSQRDQPSSISDTSNNEIDKDNLDDHTQQCKQVGQGELVIAASSYNWYSHNHIHTIVCRYCREEVNSCYYEDHLVNCLESNKYGQGHCLVVDKMVQVARRQVTSKDNGFAVNCVAVQETFT